MLWLLVISMTMTAAVIGDCTTPVKYAAMPRRMQALCGRITSYNVCYTKLLRGLFSPSLSAGAGLGSIVAPYISDIPHIV